jgi:CheY-like chemotaxis protein/HPt (histidine-containing phosphotransfer) domain-containing protein
MQSEEIKDFSEVSILVVEDNMVNQLLIKNVLKKFGFVRIDSAENGKTALSKLDSNIYDLVLMDIQLPDMDGYEITRAIRASEKNTLKSVPVIAVTGDPSEKEKAKADEAGMNDYVVKPYSPDELLKTLSKYAGAEKSNSNTAVPAPGPAAGMNLDFLVKFTGGDQELTIRLLEIFLEQVPDSIDRIGKLLPERKWQEIYPIAHKIKSSFAIFELEESKNCILKIEEYSRDQIKLDTLPALFSQYKAASEKAVLDLQMELKKLKSLHA